MRNPLVKRLPREFKSDLGKYVVIFLFMVMLISLVSGFLVADNSMLSAYEQGFEKYNIEHGHITFDSAPSDELIEKIENECDITLYDLRFFDAVMENDDQTTRIYIDREIVNTECLMSGEMPQADDEIAIDRMFASNNEIKVGDTISANGKALKVTGLVAFPDYSSLFKSNTDMMFDALNFNVGVMTENGFENVKSGRVQYNYAWQYNCDYDRNDKVKANELSENLIENLTDVITEYDVNLITSGKPNSVIKVSDYVPQYLNQAINFTGDDMGGDKAMFIMFSYIVIMILAFIFAVTTSNTISSEAGVIGTLRASGYSRRELTVHYLILPVAVTLISAVVGNVLGYTYFKNVMADLYYNSYSLPTYVVLWNADAFITTTVVPIIIMLIVNLLVISSKMKLTPLQFLRRELKRKPKKKAFRLNTKISFLTRFKLRIIFQNLGSFAVMAFGIVIGAVVIIFGDMFGTMFQDYSALVKDSIICKYQYVLSEACETENSNAEKYSMTSLDFQYKDFLKDEISVYGIEDNSRYVTAEIENSGTAVSSALSKKYGIEKGDSITLCEAYSKGSYTFTVDSVYDYEASLAVFISREQYNKTFGQQEDYFTGYFSDEELTDIDDSKILSVVTEKDFTKLSDQMEHSMGDMMKFFGYFGVIMFVLIMYILSKQVIEKNFQSISMCKILGFKDSEIGGLYILSTSASVIIGLLIAIPLTDIILSWAFSSYLYKAVTGYFPYNIRTECFVKMVVMGLVSYAVVAILQMIKISRVPKGEALKNRE